MADQIKGRLRSYYEVLLLFSIATACLPLTLLSNPLLLIRSPSAFRSKWFERLWNIIGPMQAGKPLQVSNIEDVMSCARGVVLELGPGTGEQAYHLKPNQITKMYGAEPNEFLHAKLLEKSKAAGLGGKYIPMVAGGQPASLLVALKKQGLIPKDSVTLPEDGIFDSIVTVKVLCSVPRDQVAVTLAVIQKLLKPNGQFLFFEHVENNTDQITQLFVSVVNKVWPYVNGGCHLDSKIDRILLGMGGWSERQVQTTREFQGYEPIRYVKGICTKA